MSSLLDLRCCPAVRTSSGRKEEGGIDTRKGGREPWRFVPRLKCTQAQVTSLYWVCEGEAGEAGARGRGGRWREPGKACSQSTGVRRGQAAAAAPGGWAAGHGGPRGPARRTLFFRCRRCRPGKRWQMSVKSVPNWLRACGGGAQALGVKACSRAGGAAVHKAGARPARCLHGWQPASDTFSAGMAMHVCVPTQAVQRAMGLGCGRRKAR